MKKLLTVFITSVLTLLTISILVMAEVPSDWAVSEVQTAIDAGFVPQEFQSHYTDSITRKEFSKLAVLFTATELGYTYEEFKAYIAENAAGYSYADCYDEYVILAAEAGFVYGTGDGLFEPDRAITREEAATLLTRVYYNYGSNSHYFGADFEDVSEISEWALSGVCWCVNKGVMKGISDTHFDPKGTYTREQAIVTFARLAENDEWQKYNQNASIRRKMTLDIAVEEILSSPIYSYKQQFNTPYGTVLYMSQGGVMHLQSREVIMVVKIEDGEVKAHDFGAYVARYNEYGGIPGFCDVKLCNDPKYITFNVFYEDERYLSDGTLLHKAGIYYFTINLETWEIFMEHSPVENIAREIAVREFYKADHRYICERFDSTAGTVLYWHTSGVPHAPSYAITLITNDGEVVDLTTPVPHATGWYSKPALEELTLSEDGTRMTFEVSFAQRAVTQMDGEKVLHEAGTYYFEADLVKGECVLKEFIPIEE